ncbi:hypothetical protein NDK43_30930 [Neobacillus pocheonensis]|uniref:PNPLA domain-containing protein n=1 Tax=Neobacillus pocheonensis TaxID=363869 RepID=A0ABT0WK39_9BACI|nr:hypothetical protein [Neobacillus pocheonensis]
MTAAKLAIWPTPKLKSVAARESPIPFFNIATPRLWMDGGLKEKFSFQIIENSIQQNAIWMELQLEQQFR